MTIREAAIQGMKELGFDETKIARLLAFMDDDSRGRSTGKLVLGKLQEQLPPDEERLVIEVAKKYFAGNDSLPSDN